MYLQKSARGFHSDPMTMDEKQGWQGKAVFGVGGGITAAALGHTYLHNRKVEAAARLASKGGIGKKILGGGLGVAALGGIGLGLKHMLAGGGTKTVAKARAGAEASTPILPEILDFFKKLEQRHDTVFTTGHVRNATWHNASLTPAEREPILDKHPRPASLIPLPSHEAVDQVLQTDKRDQAIKDIHRYMKSLLPAEHHARYDALALEHVPMALHSQAYDLSKQTRLAAMVERQHPSFAGDASYLAHRQNVNKKAVDGVSESLGSYETRKIEQEKFWESKRAKKDKG